MLNNIQIFSTFLIVLLPLVLAGTRILAKCHTTPPTINIVSFSSFICWKITIYPHICTVRFYIGGTVTIMSRVRKTVKSASLVFHVCISFCLSSLLYGPLEKLVLNWTDFNEIWYSRNFENLLKKSRLIKIWQA